MKRNDPRGVLGRKRKFSSKESGNNQVLAKYMMKSLLKFLLCAGVGGDLYEWEVGIAGAAVIKQQASVCSDGGNWTGCCRL